jgi:hypothetical protein
LAWDNPGFVISLQRSGHGARRLSDKAARTGNARVDPKFMMRLLIAFLLAAGSWATVAQATDRLDSAECEVARGELEAALDDPATGRAARAERIARARQNVLGACLGTPSAQPQRSGAPQPAIAVPAPIIAAPPAPPPPAPGAAPPPAPPAHRPAFITACDPAGCWDNEGRRLNNIGPALMGPRGLCTVQGGTVNCP